MNDRVAIPFFIDQNVADSVGRALVAAGHEVTNLREVMVTTTADTVIAIGCSKSGHVLVTHDRDFRQIAKRLHITQRQYRMRLHRIQLLCDFPNAAKRVKDALSLIEYEWQLTDGRRPSVIEIRETSMAIHR